jgi:putative cell wall-binding protein
VRIRAAVAVGVVGAALVAGIAPVQAHDKSEAEVDGLEVEARPAVVDLGERVVIDAEYEPEKGADDPADEDEADDDHGGHGRGRGRGHGGDEQEDDDDVEAAAVDAVLTVSFGDGTDPVEMTVRKAKEDEVKAVASHTYAAEGAYTVTVTAESTTASVTVQVGAGSARLAGDDRGRTAARISREMFPDGGADAVVLARWDGFADALASASFARLLDAPVLLTPTAEVPADVLTELDRVLGDGGDVYLLGGEAAVAPAVEATLAASGYVVHRVAGADRVATSVAIAEAIQASGKAIHEVVVTGATTFADALSGAAFAARDSSPILLTAPDALSEPVAAFLGSLEAPVEVTVVGGVASVSDAVLAQLRGLATEVKRIAGSNRYASSAAVAEAEFPSPDAVVLATGRSFPDALAGAAYAARLGAPLLLVDDHLPEAHRGFLNRFKGKIRKVIVLGGDAAVPPAVVDEVDAAADVAQSSSDA